MFSVMISGVLFLSQVIPFIKPIVDATLMCSSGGCHTGG